MSDKNFSSGSRSSNSSSPRLMISLIDILFSVEHLLYKVINFFSAFSVLQKFSYSVLFIAACVFFFIHFHSDYLCQCSARVTHFVQRESTGASWTVQPGHLSSPPTRKDGQNVYCVLPFWQDLQWYARPKINRAVYLLGQN